MRFEEKVWIRRRASADKRNRQRNPEVSDAGTSSEPLVPHSRKECSLMSAEFVVV